MSQNSIFPNKIQLSFPVPNWPYHFFQKFSSAQQNQLSPLIENLISPFLKHLSLEFGVFHRKNPKLALQKYQEAAEINDSMSNLRLFYIYSQENKKFHLAHNQDLAILHLIQASAFWNPTLRIGIANPKILLAKILDSEDNQLYKARLVINKYVKGVERKSFLTNWLMNTFPIEKELAEFHLEEIINQAENGKEPEACFYYGEILREESKIQKEKTHKARDMLEIARKANLSKSFFGLSKILEELGENDEAINLLKKGGKMGCTNCLHYLANKLALEGKNQKKALKYAFQAFLLGDLTAGHTFCDIGKSIINNNNDQKPIIGKQIKEISESLISMDYESCKEMFQVGANIYLLAQCYLKGFGCNYNYEKALEIIEKGLNNNFICDKKYLWFIKAKILRKLNKDVGNCFEECFELYLNYFQNEINDRFSQHYYRLGKFFEKGWGVEVSKFYSIECYKKGEEFLKKSDLFWIQYVYAQKCKAKI